MTKKNAATAVEIRIDLRLRLPTSMLALHFLRDVTAAATVYTSKNTNGTLKKYRRHPKWLPGIRRTQTIFLVRGVPKSLAPRAEKKQTTAVVWIPQHACSGPCARLCKRCKTHYPLAFTMRPARTTLRAKRNINFYLPTKKRLSDATAWLAKKASCSPRVALPVRERTHAPSLNNSRLT